MTTTIIIVAVLVIIALVGVFALVRYGLRSSGGSTDVQLRLEEYANRSDTLLTLEEIELSQPFSQRVIRPMLLNLAKGFSRLSPKKTREAAELQLELAGRPNNWGATEFFGLRVFVAIVMGILIFLLATFSSPGWAIVYGLGAALIGYFMPILWLRSKIRQRQTEIIKTLPDALDLLTITVEASISRKKRWAFA